MAKGWNYKITKNGVTYTKNSNTGAIVSRSPAKGGSSSSKGGSSGSFSGKVTNLNTGVTKTIVDNKVVSTSKGNSRSSNNSKSTTATPVMGTFIDAKTGLGYSGIQKSAFDKPTTNFGLSTTTLSSSNSGDSSSSNKTSSAFNNGNNSAPNTLQAVTLENTKPTSFFQASVESAKLATQNVIKAGQQIFTGKQAQYDDVTSPFQKRNAINNQYGQYFEPPVYYLGDKQYNLGETVTTPTLGGKGTNIIQVGTIEDIKPEYDTSIIKKIEERIPGAGVPITSWNEQVYLPTVEDSKKFASLLDKNNAVELNKFLRDNQAQYKKDLGRFNQLNNIPQNQLTDKEYKELNSLYNTLSSSYSNPGKFKNIVLNASSEAEAEGKKVNFFGLNIKPTTATAGLGFARSAYELEKEILPFTVGLGIAGTLAKTSTTVARGLAVASKFDKPLKLSLLPFGGAAAIGTGIGEYKSTGDLKYSLASGIGAGAGFFGGIYAGKIVNTGVVGFRKAGRGIRFVGERLGSNPLSTEGPKLITNKRGSSQVTASPESKLGANEEFVYDAQGRIIGIKKKVTRNIIEDYLKYGKDRKNIKLADDYSTKAERAKELLKRLNRDKPNALDEYKKLIRDNYGDDFARDFFQQEGLITLRNRTPERPDTLNFFDSNFKPKEPIKPKGDSKVDTGLGETRFNQPTRTRFREPTRTRTGLRDNLRTGIRTGSRFAPLFGIASAGAFRTDTRQDSGIKSLSASATKQDQGTPQVEETKVSIIPSTRSGTTTSTDLGIIGSYPAERNKPRKIERPKEPTPFEPFGFGLPERKKKAEVISSYKAQVKIDATKGRKARWKTVANKVPLVTALSKGGEYVDQTPSNRFRVVPQKGKPKGIVDKTWEALQGKFREYTQKGGIKVGLKPRNYIEKRKYRIDSPNEKKEIPSVGRVAIARRFGRI